jgi:hypothetical protein
MGWLYSGKYDSTENVSMKIHIYNTVIINKQLVLGQFLLKVDDQRALFLVSNKHLPNACNYACIQLSSTYIVSKPSKAM